MQLVFLHALPFDGRMWEHTAAAIPDSIVVENLFALGDSIEAWAPAVLEQCDGDELIVVGCSVGGSCALEVARVASDRVAAVVLVGAKAGVRPEPVLRDEAIRLLETEGMAAAWQRYWLPLFADTTPASVIETARQWATSHDVVSVVRGVRAFHDRPDNSDFAATWDRPLIGISGDRDVAPSPSTLRRLATGPNRSFHLVPDCGHYVNLEQPQRFDDLLTGVVRQISGER